MQKDIYLIRHGETDFNRRGVVQGSGVDSDLNDLGHSQALAFFEHYQHIPFDKIYTSRLKRTHQSVRSFLDMGIPWEQHEGLNEISWGHKEGKTPNPADNQYYQQLVKTWRKGGVDVAAEGGESPVHVMERQKPFLELMLSRPEEKTVLVAMHGRAMRVLLAHVLQKPLHAMDRFAHTNLCLYRLRYDYLASGFELLESCNTQHLLGLPASF